LRRSARIAEEVNQVLLDLAMEASIGRPIYGDAERHHVYREAELEVDARNRHQTSLVDEQVRRARPNRAPKFQRPQI
jgi:hypothetical protein